MEDAATLLLLGKGPLEMEENGSETELKTLDDEALADRLDAGALAEPVMIVGEDVAEPEIEVGTNVTVTLGRVVGF